MTTTSHDRGVQRRTGVAVWKQIADTLTQELRDRAYATTGCLPSEQVLAARFKVNRHTLRQALAALEQAGLIRIEQGRGAFVEHDWVDYTVARRTRYSENIVRNQLLPASRMLAGREETASAPVALALRLRKGARVLVAELLQLEMLAGGRTVSEMLRHFGIEDYFRAHNRVTTQMPSDELARLLQQPRTRPVLHVESIDVDADGTPIKVGEVVFSGDRLQIVFDPER